MKWHWYGSCWKQNAYPHGAYLLQNACFFGSTTQKSFSMCFNRNYSTVHLQHANQTPVTVPPYHRLRKRAYCNMKVKKWQELRKNFCYCSWALNGICTDNYESKWVEQFRSHVGLHNLLPKYSQEKKLQSMRIQFNEELHHYLHHNQDKSLRVVKLEKQSQVSFRWA